MHMQLFPLSTRTKREEMAKTKKRGARAGLAPDAGSAGALPDVQTEPAVDTIIDSVEGASLIVPALAKVAEASILSLPVLESLGDTVGDKVPLSMCTHNAKQMVDVLKEISAAVVKTSPDHLISLSRALGR